MQNDKKKNTHKKIEENNLRQLELTWANHYSQHEIKIKKEDFQKKKLTKKTKVK
jgi:hypothetical protein